MGKILKKIEEAIAGIVGATGIKKKDFDKIVVSSGWLILAYIILKNINKSVAKKGGKNE